MLMSAEKHVERRDHGTEIEEAIYSQTQIDLSAMPSSVTN